MSTTVSISTTASKRGSRKAASLARSISELPDGEHVSRESIAEEEEQEEPTCIFSEIFYDEYEEEKRDVDKWKELVKPTDRPRRVLSLLERWRGWQVKFAIKEYIFSLRVISFVYGVSRSETLSENNLIRLARIAHDYKYN